MNTAPIPPLLVSLMILLVPHASAGEDPVGRIVVAHDVNTLATARADDQSALFAANVAEYLIGHDSGDVLLIETEPPFMGTAYAPEVVDAITDAGFGVVVADALEPLPPLHGFDAVFVGIAERDVFTTIDPLVFTEYIRDGGGAYVFSGVGSDRLAEAAALNQLIEPFGIAFDGARVNDGPGGYNDIRNVAIDPLAHPIFAGIAVLRAGNGQCMTLVGGVPGAHIVWSAEIPGGPCAVYGVIEVPACPSDLAPPFGVLDLADITAFTTLFLAGVPAVDLNDDGVFDLADIGAFVGSFTAGCP